MKIWSIDKCVSMVVTDISSFYLHANCPSFSVISLKTNALCSEKFKNIFYSIICQGERVFPFMNRDYCIMQTEQDNVFCLSADYRLGLWLILLRGFIFCMLHEVNDTLYSLLESFFSFLCFVFLFLLRIIKKI